MLPKYLDCMLTTITAFMIMSPALQSAGLPANVKSKFPTIIGKSKAVVDKVLGKGAKEEIDLPGYVQFRYAVKGTTDGIEVLFKKNLKASVFFSVSIPDPTTDWKECLAKFGFVSSSKWTVAENSGVPVRRAVSPVKELPKHWVLVVGNDELWAKDHAKAKADYESKYGVGSYHEQSYEPKNIAIITIYDTWQNLP